MSDLRLHVLSLRYSSWSIRPWLALRAAGAEFESETIQLEDLGVQSTEKGPALVALASEQLGERRRRGSVTGLFPVLYINGTPVHESLAICEWVADRYPEAHLWPEDPLERAQARAVCCEMSTGFQNLRTQMGCHVFARVPGFQPNPATAIDIARVKEIWRGSLERSQGPFLFGRFGIPDCFYFPVLTRFRTYGITLEPELEAYAERLESHSAVRAWRKLAASAPATPVYDEMIRGLGGDVNMGLTE